MIDRQIGQVLNDSRGPSDSQAQDVCRLANAKMDQQTILAAISASGGDLTDLAHECAGDFRRQLDPGSNGGAVGNPPFALDGQPMI